MWTCSYLLGCMEKREAEWKQEQKCRRFRSIHSGKNMSIWGYLGCRGQEDESDANTDLWQSCVSVRAEKTAINGRKQVNK